VFETALEAGAKDAEEDEGMYMITCEIPDFGALAKALEKYGEPESAKIVWQPKVTVPLEGEEATKLERFVEAFEDNDDVQEVYTNGEY
jgi:transcriptional/translational regulatory protein YebC/TACO1